MKSLSRRDLITGVFGKTKSDLHLSPVTSEIVIGQLQDFPVGMINEFHHLQMTVESLPEGIRVGQINDPSQWYAIKINRFGQLVVNPNEKWSEDTVFSPMTGEPIKLDSK